MPTRRLVLLVSLIVAMTAACAGTGASPPLTMTATTLMYRWEHHFPSNGLLVRGRTVPDESLVTFITGTASTHRTSVSSHRPWTPPAPLSVSASRLCPAAWEDPGAPTSRSRICRWPARIESAFGTTPGSKAQATSADGPARIPSDAEHAGR